MNSRNETVNGLSARGRRGEGPSGNAQSFKAHALEVASASLAFLVCVTLAAVVSTFTHPPFGEPVPMADWPSGGL
jgi:hypothetical protein